MDRPDEAAHNIAHQAMLEHREANRLTAEKLKLDQLAVEVAGKHAKTQKIAAISAVIAAIAAVIAAIAGIVNMILTVKGLNHA